MGINNYIVSFPYPSWSNLTDNDTGLIKKPYCICWYELDEHNDITYGFKNITAKEFLKRLFSKVMLVSEDSYKLHSPEGFKSRQVYFYDDNKEFNVLKNEIERYFLLKKKNELLKKRGMILKENVNDLSYMLFEINGVISSNAINSSLKKKVPLFLSCYFTPEAGETIVLFNEDVELKIRHIAINMGVIFKKYKYISELPNPF